MIDLVEKLIDAVIRLCKEREAQRENQLAAAARVFDQFETIHTRYLLTLREQREELRAGASLKAVAEAIMTERLYSDHTRTALRELSLSEAPIAFARSIWAYLYVLPHRNTTAPCFLPAMSQASELVGFLKGHPLQYPYLEVSARIHLLEVLARGELSQAILEHTDTPARIRYDSHCGGGSYNVEIDPSVIRLLLQENDGDTSKAAIAIIDSAASQLQARYAEAVFHYRLFRDGQDPPP